MIANTTELQCKMLVLVPSFTSIMSQTKTASSFSQKNCTSTERFDSIIV